jgi:hypothetical protein
MTSDHSPGNSRAIVIVIALATAALIVAACATTRQSRGTGDATGFLGDYSNLRKGEKDEPQLIYINPNVDWASFDSIHIDSVTLWRDEKTDDVPDEEKQILTDFFFHALHTQLSKDYKMVDEPGPNVLKLRAALTEAKGSKAVMNTITSVVPQLRLLTTIVGMSAGTSVLVGKAGLEGEITDSMTGDRLLAALDQRQGTKAMRGGVKTWSDVKLATEFWAERLRGRLATLSGRTIEDE